MAFPPHSFPSTSDATPMVNRAGASRARAGRESGASRISVGAQHERAGTANFLKRGDLAESFSDREGLSKGIEAVGDRAVVKTYAGRALHLSKFIILHLCR